MHVYGIDVDFISDIFGPKPRTIFRWYSLFLEKGVVEEEKRAATKTARWPLEVLQGVERYVKGHPTFYLEELQDFLRETFPDVKNVSQSTICRALNFDLGLTRKVITRAARESVPLEIANYKAKLQAIYSYPEQLIFIDETSKDGRHAYRRYGWSSRNTKCVVKLPFSRGNRRSIFAAVDYRGFVAWETTEGTFTRTSFHRAFTKNVVPLLNPWPLPNSIVILDNAKIHLYKELEMVVHQTGARLLFLPPYSPELNPIELCFGSLKKWIQRHANLVFPLYPDEVLAVAMKVCTRRDGRGLLDVFGHCGYETTSLRNGPFDALTYCHN